MAEDFLEELVTANRILAREGVLDSFGHVSIRSPNDPRRYVMSRARAPELIELADLMEFTLDGVAIDPRGRKPYAERFIHGAIFEARPEVLAVVHNHSPSVIPFGATHTPIRPMMHMCAPIGDAVPIWDSRDHFGDTTLLVVNMEMGRDLVKTLDQGTTALMRGHGCVVTGRSLREAVFTSVYLEINAGLQTKAMSMGEITFLSAGEVKLITEARSGFTFERAWESWCRRVDRPYVPLPMNWAIEPG